MTTALLYARTSTDEQRNGMLDQRDRLLAVADARGWTPDYQPEHASGKSMARRARPIFTDTVLTRLRKLGPDGVLVVTKLDRLSRSTRDVLAIVARAEREHWNIVVLDMGGGFGTLDTTTAAGRMSLTMFAAVAQFERDIISERTKAGMAIVKARGTTKTGRPVAEALGKRSTVPTDVRARIVAERDAGASWKAIADGLNRDGVPSPGAGSKTGHNRTGTRWHATSTHRIYDVTAKETV
jgi:DNA invertase Pin-like site-specific DNA recombinase